MSSTGNLIWDKPVGGTIVSAPSIGPDGTVYAGAGSSVVAVDPSSGAVKWQVGVGGDVATTPAIAPDGTIVAGADNGKEVAITPSGTLKWQYQTGGAVRSSAAIGGDGTVYFGSGDSNLYVLDANGQKLSTYHALDAVDGAAAIAPNGLVLAGARDNHLYALKDTARTFTESPQDRLGGDLVRDASTGKVYVIVNGQRRLIPDPVTQQILGLTGPFPTNIAASELYRYPEGPALPALAEGSVIQASNGPMYVIQGGQRVWIPTLDAFAAGGYHWDSVIQVEDRVIRSIPFTVQDGMLIKGPGERVYLVSGGQRHWLTTAAALASRGYNWSQVHYVSDATLNSIPEGGSLS
jgi:outer membrane protein assembly factor BamB